MECTGSVKTHHTAQGSAVMKPDRDESEAMAVFSARQQAVIDAMTFAESITCPKACPKRQVTIDLGEAADPECNRLKAGGKRQWSCKTTCAWRVKVECVTDWLDDEEASDPDEFGGVVEQEQQPNGPNIEVHRRARCREWVKYDGTAEGFGLTRVSEDADGSKAKKEAAADAASRAQREATERALRLRCRFRCRRTRLIVIVDAPDVLDPEGKKVEDGDHKVDAWKATATCSWRTLAVCR